MVIIHCFLNNFVINVDIEPSSRLSCLWHQITSEWRVFECVDAKPATWESKTSGWSKSACSVQGRYRQRYLRVRVFINFVNNVDIEPWSRICVRGIRLHPTGVFSNVLMTKKRHDNPTRFEPGIARNTEVIADRTIWDKWTDGNYSLFP